MNPGTLAPESVFSVYVNTLRKSSQPAWGLERREAREKGAWRRGTRGNGRWRCAGRGGSRGSPGAEPELFNSRLEVVEDLPALLGLGRAALSLHRSPGLAAGAGGLQRSCGLGRVGSPEAGVRCYGDPWGRAERGKRLAGGGAADPERAASTARLPQGSPTGALCPGRPRARPPLKCPPRKLDPSRHPCEGPARPKLSSPSLLPRLCAQPPARPTHSERLPFDTNTPPHTRLEPELGARRPSPSWPSARC